MYYKKFLVFKLIVIGLFVFTCGVYASDLTSSVNKQTFTVGEILTFQVIADVPSASQVIAPVLNENLGNIIIKEWNSSKKELEKSDSVTFSYKITAYVPENCTIPSLPFIISKDNKQDTLFTKAIPLQFQSVIAVDTADTSKIDIKDLKPQLDAGKAPLWWLWVIIAIILIAASVIIYKRFFARKKVQEKVIPLLPPYEEAIASINELERKKYLSRGLIREYVFELSEILKRYIERRFEINASEFTTEEVIAWLGVSNLSTEMKQSINWFFLKSDPIKFARLIPDDETTNRFMTETMNFLNGTRPLLQDDKSTDSSKTDNSTTESKESVTADKESTGGGNAV